MSTIVALSTPRGRAALSVVRFSGPTALELVLSLVGHPSEFKPRTATLTKIEVPDTHEILDEVVVTYFKGPHSLTGEDVVEISCHGSPAVVRKIIDISLTLGARLAGPGEFTLRALSNGKLNLAQAEGIRDLIDAQTDAAARQAVRQLGGELSTSLDPLKALLIEVIVVLESAIEFVEDDLPQVQIENIKTKLGRVAEGVETLAASYRAGHLLRDGVQITIAGRPNVGKSSLFNSLVARERAIVTERPGTTRDTLTEAIDIGGVPVVLTDTAGVRESLDAIESLGIRRTHQAVSDADLVLTILDGSAEISNDDRLVLAAAGNKSLVVINKSDLPPVNGLSQEFPDGVRLSSKTGEGLDELKAAILRSFSTPAFESGGLLVTNARHHDLLNRVAAEVKVAENGINERRGEEVILVSLHNALRFLGEITGETTSEDILSEIFSTFCIGK